MPWRYNAEPSHVIEWKDLKLDGDVTYVDKPLRIAGTREQTLRIKTIMMVKVVWKHHPLEEATSELESDVRNKYLELPEGLNWHPSTDGNPEDRSCDNGGWYRTTLTMALAKGIVEVRGSDSKLGKSLWLEV
ncbi:hypothetical protein C5167_003167 [Papaver somniferum]|uniref:Uncharacterized protein n=1 Tax=Papaver somniferum TaxID=3469 RepID=A0A4Y7L2U2_PAPSO|nr:hypothetical protein C5167_003167 [Papaver somniferum]